MQTLPAADDYIALRHGMVHFKVFSRGWCRPRVSTKLLYSV